MRKGEAPPRNPSGQARPHRRRLSPAALLPLLLLALAAILPACSPLPADYHPDDRGGDRWISLAGPLRVSYCTDPVAACSAGDPGRAWRTVELGPRGVSGGIGHREGVAWLLLDFHVDNAVRWREPALLFTRPFDSEEVFLNGVALPHPGVSSGEFPAFPNGPRLHPVPPGLLRDGVNELSVRALFAEKKTSVLEGPVLLGRRLALEYEAERLRRPILVMETAFLTLFVFMLVVFGGLVFQRVSRPEYLHFTFFLLAYVVSFLLGSILFLPRGGASPSVLQLQGVFDALRATAMIFLVTSATEARRGWVFWSLVSLSLLLTLLGAVLPPLVHLRDASLPEKAFFTLTGIYYLWVSVSATARRRAEAPVILAGVVAYVVGTRVDLFWGLNLRDLSTGIFSLSMLVALIVRHARLRENYLKLSASLLDAHEEERRRIARDLHDGIGQSLVALRLRLQMLDGRLRKGEPPEPSVFSDLAGKTLSILEDVRRTALDLRPSYVESEGLLDLVKWYASSFEEGGGIRVSVHDPEEGPGELEPRIKENLYRIFQEALSNAAKHSGASRVDVSLYRSGNRVRLAVSDDGEGFDPSRVEGAGLGMATMRERAALLGGTLEIRGGAGKGTTVLVEVPVA